MRKEIKQKYRQLKLIQMGPTGPSGSIRFPLLDIKSISYCRGENEQAKLEEVSAISELENQWYKIKIDAERAAISSLFDKDMNKELVDQDASWKLGEFIYETLGNRSQMEAFHLDDYKREPLDSIWFERYEEGEIWNTIHFKGNTKAAIYDRAYEFEIRLFNTTKRIRSCIFNSKEISY